MFLIIHALLGALLALNFDSLSLIIFFALLTHFVLDFIPHWDGHFDHAYFKLFGTITLGKNKVKIVGIDLIITLIVTIFLTLHFNNWIIFFSAFIATLPDTLGLLYFTPFQKNKLFKKYLLFHSGIQSSTPFFLGIFIQIILALVFLRLLFP